MTVSVAGKKTWIDDNNSQNSRTDAIAIELYQNNEKIDEKMLQHLINGCTILVHG